MPHVIVKLATGKSEAQKQQLADAITREVIAVLDYSEEAVSVTLQEIAPDDWAEQVYRTDIQHPTGKLYKKPGYSL